MQYDVWNSKNRLTSEMLKEQQRAEYKQQQMNAPIPDLKEKVCSFFVKYNTTVMEAIKLDHLSKVNSHKI